MKKFFATTLAVTMAAATLGTTAFAEGSSTKLTDTAKSVEIQVKGEYIDLKKSDEIISMDVVWDSMEFTYAAKQQGTWDPATHSYKESSDEADWVGDTTSNITVTNHSNVDVTASFAFVAANDYSEVTGKFTQKKEEASKVVSSVDLEVGKENDYDGADKETVTFTIGGTMDDEKKGESIQIGTITVSVEKKVAD